ncbi:MAG: SRPBCC family protein [Verrucomicrobiota bacterium]
MNPSIQDREFATSRALSASPAEVLAAIADPQRLARWWGPNGFTNTIHEFDFQPGGTWIHDMHGPDGSVYPNRSVFVETGPQRIVIEHLETVHHFILTLTLEPAANGTLLTWRQTFDSVEECDLVRPYVPRCNEENLDRLEAELKLLTHPTNP